MTPTTDHTYDRQAPLRLSVPQCVTVVGCGGVGSWTALFLALAGVPRLILWDEDTLAEHNFNRFPCGPEAVGVYKVEAMRLHLGQVKPGCDVIDRATNWTAERQRLSHITPDWIVATTDTWASRKAVYEWSTRCRTCGLLPTETPETPCSDTSPMCKYIECSAEGGMGGVAARPASFASELEDNPGYASVPVWVGPAVIGAYLACAHILHNTQLTEGHLWNIGWRDKIIAQYLGVGSGELPLP